MTRKATPRSVRLQLGNGTQPLPGEWTPPSSILPKGVAHALFGCPGCDWMVVLDTKTHTVHPNGTVEPAIECRCGWQGHITLDRWGAHE